MQKHHKSETDWDSLNMVADWVVDYLQAGKSNAPDTLVQAAIAAGIQYLNNPSNANKAEVDNLAVQLAEAEKGNTQARESGKIE